MRYEGVSQCCCKSHPLNVEPILVYVGSMCSKAQCKYRLVLNDVVRKEARHWFNAGSNGYQRQVPVATTMSHICQ